MIQNKDYIMRLIQTLISAIQNIVSKINKGDIEGAQQLIDNSFKLFGCDKEYFLNTDVEELISFLTSDNEDYLKKIELGAELLYLDATIETNIDDKKKKLKKTVLYFKYYLEVSKEYSFEINNKLNIIENELAKME